jgi:hypothetical protein
MARQACSKRGLFAAGAAICGRGETLAFCPDALRLPRPWMARQAWSKRGLFAAGAAICGRGETLTGDETFAAFEPRRASRSDVARA